MKSLAGERRAVAAAVLAFYTFAYLLLTLNAPAGWEKAFGAMSGVYALGFLGIVAGYFWARWYAIGLGLSGVITTIVSMWQIGPEPIFLFWGGTHAAIALTMWGSTMATSFDGRQEWRARFHLDEHAVNRLGKAVIRIGISLPYILLYALAPRPPGSGTLLALGVLGFATMGTWAIFRMRTWGLAALAGAGAALAVGAAQGGASSTVLGGGIDLGACAAFGSVLMFAAVMPFVRPVADYLRGR
jgi:hypothetical protein